jgi:hypothetical protein
MQGLFDGRMAVDVKLEKYEIGIVWYGFTETVLSYSSSAFDAPCADEAADRKVPGGGSRDAGVKVELMLLLRERV